MNMKMMCQCPKCNLIYETGVQFCRCGTNLDQYRKNVWLDTDGNVWDRPPAYPMSPTSPPKPKRRHTGIIIAVVIACVVLILGGAGGYIMYDRNTITRECEQIISRVDGGIYYSEGSGWTIPSSADSDAEELRRLTSRIWTDRRTRNRAEEECNLIEGINCINILNNDYKTMSIDNMEILLDKIVRVERIVKEDPSYGELRSYVDYMTRKIANGGEEYVDITGITVKDLLADMDMTKEEFYEEFGLPDDFPVIASETEAMYTIPIKSYVGMYDLDFDTAKELLNIPDRTEDGTPITEDTPWGIAQGEVSVAAYVGDSGDGAEVAEFKEEFGFGSEVTADTKWKEVRNAVDAANRDSGNFDE